MLTADFDFHLPKDLIAQAPPDRREDARLLVLDRAAQGVEHRGIPDLPDLLREGDLLVVNEARVIPARVFARRETGGRVEVLFLHPAPDGAWEALVRAGGSIREGEELTLASGPGRIGLRARLGGGHWLVEAVGEDLPSMMERAGKMPLPPYIRREEQDPRDEADRERYQTVFARDPGAIAAPTAGLHLTEPLLSDLGDRGVDVAKVTLHVGLGTFLPVQAERLEDHEMHEERYSVPEETVAAIAATRARGGRVVAVGTTTVRTLEAAASSDGSPAAGDGATRLFILPGYRFRVVDALLTNFHLPKSTLLCLVSALAGWDRVRAAYEEAVRQRYRFFSYGDAMLIV